MKRALRLGAFASNEAAYRSLLGILLLLMSGCAVVQEPLTSSTATTIQGSERYQSSVRLDRDQRPHVVFAVTQPQAMLRYRWPDGRDEPLVIFENAERTEFDFAFQLDQHDQPVLVYEQEGLWLARRTPQGWQHELIDGGPKRGYLPALALAADGQIHTSYFDLAQNDLRYATQIKGQWQHEIIDAGGRPGFHLSAGFNQISLACRVAPFCSEQQPLIIYLAYRYKPYDGELRAASPGTDGWQIETIDRTRGTGGFPSLGVTQAGVPWVSYYLASTWDFAYGELRIATRTQRGWQLETLDRGVYVGRFQALAITAQDQPIILYSGHQGQATLATLCGTWQQIPLATPAARGWITLATGANQHAWATLTSPSAQTVLVELDLSRKGDPCS